MRFIKGLFLACVAVSFTQCTQKQKESQLTGETSESKETQFEFVPQDTTWKSLSVREKIGQTMMIQTRFEDHRAVGGSIKTFMEKYPVGGLFIPDWYFREHSKGQDVLQLIPAILKEYNDNAKCPMLVCEDFERGIGETYSKYTHLPVGMSLGAAGDTTLAYNLGQSIALEAKEIGFNWLLHPVCDLNMNPLQELVVERSVSDDVDKALPILKSQMKGLHQQGVISTVKHFPGDGVTMRNQHIVTTANTLSKEEWDASFGKLFKGLINSGAASIMVGHIQLPAYQTETINGQLPPATLSKELMIDLLKNKFNYKGVIITDALNMGGCAGYYKNELEVSVQCFAAGADVVLWPSIEYMDTVEARINRGEIPMSRLDDAVSRVWAMRERFGLIEKKNELSTPLTEEAKQLVQTTGTTIAEKAVTLICDKNQDVPLSAEKSKKLLILEVGAELNEAKLQVMKEELQARHFDVDIMDNPHFYSWGWRIDSLDKYDKILVCFENRYFHPLGTCLLKDKESFAVWTANMTDPSKRIGISFANPYVLEVYEEICPLKINAYSIDAFSQRAVVKALCGEIPFSGKSPIKLNREELK
ncbi:MAG: glycoside hydrolase family 3 protein [Paludibacteraceae bacterium]|nr:glycoside hydrolase family 3 protein [Paludibacteraceae bacterium]MBR5973436.1 glycoside hydrolase family 3 protein [Paludibacteraceae bacterium]